MSGFFLAQNLFNVPWLLVLLKNRTENNWWINKPSFNPLTNNTARMIFFFGGHYISWFDAPSAHALPHWSSCPPGTTSTSTSCLFCIGQQQSLLFFGGDFQNVLRLSGRVATQNKPLVTSHLRRLAFFTKTKQVDKMKMCSSLIYVSSQPRPCRQKIKRRLRPAPISATSDGQLKCWPIQMEL